MMHDCEKSCDRHRPRSAQMPTVSNRQYQGRGQAGGARRDSSAHGSAWRSSSSWLPPGPRQGHCSKPSHVDLRVDRRGIEIPVPQDVRDLFQRSACRKQPAGRTMSENVDARMRPTTSPERSNDNLAHHAGSDRLVIRCDVANEHRSVGRDRPFHAQVSCDRTPVSIGSGNTSVRRDLLAARRIIPPCQSMSSRRSRATSLARRPRSARQRAMA